MEEYLLLTRAKKGDASAFGDLAAPYERLIYNIAYRLLNDRQEAEDAAQEALLKAYRALRSCRGSVKSWLCAITRNVCLDALRRRKPALSLNASLDGEDGEVLFSLPSKEPTPEEAALKSERLKWLEEAINALKPDYRLAVTLRDIDGFSYEEIAEITNVPVGTVKSRINRAREALRKYLRPMYDDGNNTGQDSSTR